MLLSVVLQVVVEKMQTFFFKLRFYMLSLIMPVGSREDADPFFLEALI